MKKTTSSRIEKVRQYWQEQPPTHRAMFKRAVSQELMDQEREEILSYLPNLQGEKILDLASGVGRFTRSFSTQASHLTSVDLLPHFVAKNRESHADCTNISFLCTDALSLSFPPNSFHLIFINWLFLYLEEREVPLLLKRIHSWLKPQGHLFFRETCDITTHPSPDPHYLAYYRPFRFYDELISPLFTPLRTGSLQTYIDHFADPFQGFWLCQK